MKSLFARSALLLLTLLVPMSALAAEGAPVIAALKGPSGIALVHLFENPPLLTGGREARLEAVPSADVMVAKLMSGEYQVAVLPVNMAAKLRKSGLDITLAAVIGNGMLSFLTNSPSIRTIADLRGRRVDVAGQGATPDFLFRRLLKDAGLDPQKDLTLSFALSYSDMASAIAAGTIESAILPEPFATLARMKNNALRSPIDLRSLWKNSTGMDDYPMTALVIRGNSGIGSADARIILDAVRSSIEKIVADPAGAGALVAKHGLGLPAAVAAASIPRCNFVYLEAKDARPEVEALLKEFLASSPASIGGGLPDEAFYAAY